MRWVGVACVAVTAASMGAGCRAAVLSELDERQANEVVVALDAARIAAHKERMASGGHDAFVVEVPSAEATAALRVLQAKHLPRSEPSGLEALDAQAGLVATPAEEQARWAAATAGELTRSLLRLPGVVDARVHLTPAASPRQLDDAPEAPKVGVLLLREASAPPTDERAIKALVAAAVPALAQERVTVVQLQARNEPSAERKASQVGPFSVQASSARALRATLGAAFALNLVLAVVLVVFVARLRRARSSAAAAVGGRPPAQ